ncbi:MAG: hypothetical protein ACWIPI_10100 [Polaribacter sp.]
METTIKKQYQKAIELFRNKNTINEVTTLLNVPMYRVKKWYTSYRKSEKVNLENRFIVDFGCGRFSINELAKRYNMDRRTLLKLKHKHFGKGSLKQKRMYQMHKAEIPTRAIADFFNAHTVQVNQAIRIQRAKNT